MVLLGCVNKFSKELNEDLEVGPFELWTISARMSEKENCMAHNRVCPCTFCTANCFLLYGYYLIYLCLECQLLNFQDGVCYHHV